jgi:ATP-binding cassette, subfamily B, bacterial
VVHEVLGSFRVVKAFGREEAEQQRFEGKSQLSVRKKVGITAREGALDLLINLTTAAGTGLVLYVGAHRVQANAVTVGELLIVVNYLVRLYSPLKTITRQVTGLQRNYESLQRSFEILDEVPDVQERPDARRLRRAQGHVELHDVSFSYDGEHPVLEDVSLDVPAGTRVGIAGRTGAGKSTLVSLMLRFYDVDRGRVLLDGVDVRDYRLADLRSQFAMVLQEPVLFATSIAENIAYGRPGASFDAVREAAAAAGVDHFIEHLPNGYDTLVGERGQRLSGGERQRISLARAFLKDAPILLLDEPTSSVDVQTEAAILESMERLMAGRTTFMIAHRPSTLDVCDVVLQVGEQRVVPRRAVAT